MEGQSQMDVTKWVVRLVQGEGALEWMVVDDG